jgi:GTP-binding protein Era
MARWNETGSSAGLITRNIRQWTTRAGFVALIGERKDGSARIDQVVYVARDGHKGIVLGHKGETIKSVGRASREELEEFLGRKVHLFVTVKVRPNWLDEAERYSEMGLDIRDGS